MNIPPTVLFIALNQADGNNRYVNNTTLFSKNEYMGNTKIDF